MDKIKRIQELVRECNFYRDEYYNKNNSVVSDSEYDKFFDELKSLEEETSFVLSNSPTQTVGYKVIDGFSKVEHKTPLLSLNKTKSIDDIKKFQNGKILIAMHKLDGLTVELEYEDGVLKRGSTRGDGDIGEDITHNVSFFKNVPLKVPCEGYVRISGEAIIHKHDFEKLNDNLTEDEKKKLPKGKYSTCRNLVSGSVRQLNSEVCSKRNVYFYAYNLLDYEEETQSKRMDFGILSMLGFTVVDWKYVYEESQRIDIDISVKSLKQSAKENGIPIDGYVFTYNDKEYSNSLQITGHHPLHSIALKEEDEKEETILRDIEWSMGRTGQLTPVAIFDTVELDGTEVSRASLHNISIIESLELGIGDTVSVSKMNMIIPKIVENKTKSNNISIPHYCSICGEPTSIIKDNDSKVLICSNKKCYGIKIKKFTHFVSKPAMNIDGLSESTLEKFINEGWLKTFSDIYKLDRYKDVIVNMEGFGQKSYKKLWTSIENSKNVKLENLLVALGIPNIGKTASKEISKYFDGDIVKLSQSANEGFDFTQLKDFGQVMNDSLCEYFRSSDEYIDLLDVITFIKPNQNAPVSSKNPLYGCKIYCTGTFAGYKKDQLKEIIDSLGAEFGSGYSKSLDYLIVGSVKSSGKEDKARKDGVKILSEEEFIKMIGD